MKTPTDGRGAGRASDQIGPAVVDAQALVLAWNEKRHDSTADALADLEIMATKLLAARDTELTRLKGEVEVLRDQLSHALAARKAWKAFAIDTRASEDAADEADRPLQDWGLVPVPAATDALPKTTGNGATQ